MSSPPPQLPTAFIVNLARRLPADDMAALADAARAGADGLAALRSRSSNPTLRDACAHLAGYAAPETASLLSGALSGAAAAVGTMRAAQTLDVVWTGPDLPDAGGRLTGPTLTELIAEAQEEVMLVSYAVQGHPALLETVTDALRRGVDVTVLLERHADNPRYTAAADAFAGLPLRRWVWPADRRPPGAALHAKIAVIDRRVALLGSANLTGRALTANLECGVLIRGGPEPAAIAERLLALRYAGTFVEVR